MIATSTLSTILMFGYVYLWVSSWLSEYPHDPMLIEVVIKVMDPSKG